jgi:hypothetical protein
MPEMAKRPAPNMAPSKLVHWTPRSKNMMQRHKGTSCSDATGALSGTGATQQQPTANSKPQPSDSRLGHGLTLHHMP